MAVWVWLLPLLLRLSEGEILGAAVNIEPIHQDSLQVRAHFSVLYAQPCPAEDRNLLQSSPQDGLFPPPGWCLHQWQKPVPMNYTCTFPLGSLHTQADPAIRPDTGTVNRPPAVALPPPVRFQVGCPQELQVFVLDLDGDEIHCRFAWNELPESLHLNQTCLLLYDGGAPSGQYRVQIVVEDFPPYREFPVDQSLSSVPLLLTITVGNASDCVAVPVFTGAAPAGGSVLHMLPFQEVSFNITAMSAQAVSEVAIIGPPGLFSSPVGNGPDLMSSVTLSWVRGPNGLAVLLSVCFAANTQSLQSEIRCLWLQQTQTDPLPPGTELTCDEQKLQMSLVLPTSFLQNVPLFGLQLNDPVCPVQYNSTHVTASFPLTACGTKRTHFGSELLYTNTLRSSSPNTGISRSATLVLPLACRIAAQQVAGPDSQVFMPSELEVFGAVSFWLEFYPPGEGPLAVVTRDPVLRSLRPARSPVEGRTNVLDLHVFSNCSLVNAQLMVDDCVQSETLDFQQKSTLLTRGCSAANGTLEIVTGSPMVRVFRLYLNSLGIQGNTMYVRCDLQLCVMTQESLSCPDQCSPATQSSLLVDSVFTRTYSVTSDPVQLLNSGPQVNSTTAAAPQTAKLSVSSRSPGRFCHAGHVTYALAAVYLLCMDTLDAS